MDKIISTIAFELGIKEVQVKNTINLIDEGNTIPFIARYRKEATGNLSDETLREFGERLTYLRNLEEKNLILFSEINPSNTLEQLNSLFNSNLVADYNDYIRSRIADLLPNLYLTPNNIYSSSEVPEYIISYHQIETLKELEGIIPTSNERVPLIVAKYEIILASVRVMDFFIEYNGNISDVRLLDDELSAYLLDVDMDEYEFDRSECLTRLSIEYFDRLNNSEKNLTPLEHARETIVKLFVSLAIDKLLPEEFMEWRVFRIFRRSTSNEVRKKILRYMVETFLMNVFVFSGIRFYNL